MNNNLSINLLSYKKKKINQLLKNIKKIEIICNNLKYFENIQSGGFNIKKLFNRISINKEYFTIIDLKSFKERNNKTYFNIFGNIIPEDLFTNISLKNKSYINFIEFEYYYLKNIRSNNNKNKKNNIISMINNINTYIIKTKESLDIIDERLNQGALFVNPICENKKGSDCWKEIKNIFENINNEMILNKKL